MHEDYDYPIQTPLPLVMKGLFDNICSGDGLATHMGFYSLNRRRNMNKGIPIVT